MKKIHYVPVFFILLLVFACENNKKIDTDKPIIDLGFNKSFPTYCDTLYFGDTITFKALFKDNVELGAYSVDIHHNFDHHSHGHKIEACSLAQKKQAFNPLVLIIDFEVPESQNEFEANQEIPIPKSNSTGLFDAGDYHFQVYLTDKEGWTTTLGLSVKLFHRSGE